MNIAIQNEWKKRKELADQITVAPYDEVKKNLDARAAETAKKAADGMVELFSRPRTAHEG